MARPRTHCNIGKAPTNDSDTPVLTPTVFCAPTPAPAQTSVLAKAPTPVQAPTPTPTSASDSVLGPSGRYTDKDLQRSTKLTLELFVKGQEHVQLQESTAPHNCLFKAWNPNFYYRSLHIECYYFCQQCKDYFNIIRATSHKRILFAASFLKDWINFCWQQHKMHVKSDNAISSIWDKFKAFFRQSFGKSTLFVTNIWTKIKWDS